MIFNEYELGGGQDRGRVITVTVPDDFVLTGFRVVPSRYFLFGTGVSQTTLDRYFYLHYSDESEAQNIIAYIGSEVDGGDHLCHCFEVEPPPPESELWLTVEQRAAKAKGRK